jgi:hypothetical protein
MFAYGVPRCESGEGPMRPEGTRIDTYDYVWSNSQGSRKGGSKRPKGTRESISKEIQRAGGPQSSSPCDLADPANARRDVLFGALVLQMES